MLDIANPRLRSFRPIPNDMHAVISAQRELRTAEEALATRLVELYKADEPDVLTVVLEAGGRRDVGHG